MNKTIAMITAGILAVGLLGIASYTGSVWAASTASTAGVFGAGSGTVTSNAAAAPGLAASAGHLNGAVPFGATSATATDFSNHNVDAASGIGPVCASGANAIEGTCSSTR
jgi:hypothetical protein